MNASESPTSTPLPTSRQIPQLWLVGLFAGAILTAIVSGLLLSSVEKLFFPPDHGQMTDPPEYLMAVRNALMANRGIGYAVFGASLFGLVGCVLGTLQGKLVSKLLIGAIAGGLLMGLAGAAGSFIESELYTSESPFWRDMDGMFKAPLIIGALFALAGIIPAILATSKELPLVQTLGKGLGCALGFLILYIVLGTAVFPLGNVDAVFDAHRPIAFTGLVCMGLCAATCAFWLNRSKPTDVQVKS